MKENMGTMTLGGQEILEKYAGLAKG